MNKDLTQGPVMGFMLRFAVPLGNPGGAGDHDWNPFLHIPKESVAFLEEPSE